MNSEEPSIKHLVISSGGPAGHMMYSILRTLNLKGVWDPKNITSIYGSSIGSFVAIIIALRYEWEVMDDYLIKRPWEKIYTSSSSLSSSGGDQAANDHSTSSASSSLSDAKNKLDYVFKLYKNHGLYGLKEFTEMLRPALQGKDIPVNITFQEFYERTGIELHFMVTELNKFQTIDFNHKTHPKQGLVEACYMSCCYPFGFTPVYRDGCCYIDGGIINDYPVNECIRDQKCDLREILGVKMLWERKPANLTDKSSVLQFISTFFNQIKGNLFENRPTSPIPNEVVCVSKVFASQDWMNWMKDENYRRELVLRGETFANVFMSYRRNFRESVTSSIHSEMATGAVKSTATTTATTTTTTTTTTAATELVALSTYTEASEQAPEQETQNTSIEEEETYSITTNDVTMI
jgi:predicted acylesterase/phospholipase RssA